MAEDKIVEVALSTASELLCQSLFAISDTANAAHEVIMQKENFKRFSSYLDKIASILKEFSKQNIDHHHSDILKNVMEILIREAKFAKQLILECSQRNKVYLLLNCHKIVKHLEGCSKEIGRAVSLIPLASLNICCSMHDQITELCKSMSDAEYRAAVSDEEILAKIGIGIQERHSDRAYANQLLSNIAEAVGISTEQSTLKKEFEEFKSEIENVKLRKDMAEALQMEQIIALLEKADAATSTREKEQKYFEKRNSLGRQPLEPLQSFYCPISHDVMADPVETSSGKTFERSAIQRWFDQGNSHCPLTSLPLETLFLRPNKNLRESIQEWKDRNTIITISSLKMEIQSNSEWDVLQSLGKLKDICMERELHREWVKMEDYIPILVGLLGSKNPEIRNKALIILYLLAKDNAENKEDIGRAEKALESIVHSLARRIEESKLALKLLLELSTCNIVHDQIGTIQGSIFLLVTLLHNNDHEAAENAEEILGNLSFFNQNVIEMAKANYFKPLLRNLSSGTQSVKISMAKTLAEITLSDQNKFSIVKDGALGPLLQLLLNDDLEIKKIAVKALLHLSSVPENGLQMIREGVVEPLFEFLYRHSLQSPTLCQQVAATIMHLALSTCGQEADGEHVSLLKSEEDIFKFFSLISFTVPEIQGSILNAFHAMCQSPSGFDIRKKLRQLSAVQVLVHLCELENQVVRFHAVKLFYCLTQDGDEGAFLEHVSKRLAETLVRIIDSSDVIEEVGAAMGSISNLPKDPQITTWLLNSGVLQTIFKCLTDEQRHAPHKRQVVENSAQALCRFTVSTNLEWQKTVAEAGFIPLLVQLLVSGTAPAKRNAAISVKQFSESSNRLSKPAKKPLFCCYTARDIVCPAHLGICTVESSFCILEAKALEPLVTMLTEKDHVMCEASLDALLTLITGERLHSGSKVLAEANAIPQMIKLLNFHIAGFQEKILAALERIFQLDAMKEKYKSLAIMPLVEITQRKDSPLKSLAAKVLAQLEVLNKQSSYF